jgi:hypothetical protein
MVGELDSEGNSLCVAFREIDDGEAQKIWANWRRTGEVTGLRTIGFVVN